MDFADVDLEENSETGADCHIHHPVTGDLLYDEDGDPITIGVYGVDSRAFRQALQQQSDKAATKRKVTLDNAEARAVELVSAAVFRWSKGIVWEGKPLECTPANVRKFLAKFRPIRMELDDFMADRGNFSKSAETN